jgi:hypothetical protein
VTDFSKQWREHEPEPREVPFGADPAAAAKQAQDAERMLTDPPDSITVDVEPAPTPPDTADSDQHPRWFKIDGSEFEQEQP